MCVFVYVPVSTLVYPLCTVLNIGVHVSAYGRVGYTQKHRLCVCLGLCVGFGCACVYRDQARPLAAPGAQSPFPVVQCDKFPCQILPAPLYF